MPPIKQKVWGAPGCGKTYYLMKKYKQFISEGYTAEDISVTTYRKSSAQDLINSVTRDIGLSRAEMDGHVGTFHSICYHLLRDYNYKLVEEKDRNDFLKESGYAKYHKVSNVGDDEQGKSGSLFDFSEWMAETMTPDEEWYKYPSSGKMTLPENKVTPFLDDWNTYKHKSNKIDYSDMPGKVLVSRPFNY